MKVKKLYIFTYSIIGLVITIVVFGTILYKNIDQKESRNLEISSNSISAENPNLSHTTDDEYFELVGFGQLEVNENNPNINLINPSNNNVYLSFDVIYNDNLLYQTKLIEPGMMEQYDIYSGLDAGEHTIDYSINVYDIDSQTPLWTGIKQKQEILIKK